MQHDGISSLRPDELNQSVNDTEAHPQLGQVDYELKFLKSVRQFYAQARALSSKLNNIKADKN